MDSVDRRQSMNTAEKKWLIVFLQAHEPFREIRQTMPMQYVRPFLVLALDEDKGVTEYTR
jgi:hypothetical protein